MANLKDIRSRIASVQSTKQITNAMKMVAAAKLRKAQDAVTRLRPYATKQYEILEHLSSSESKDVETPYTEKSEADKILIVAISSNRGLCGPFNANVAKEIIELTESGEYKTAYRSGNLDILTIGKKAGDILLSKGYEITERVDDIYDALNFETVSKQAERLMSAFVKGEYKRIDLVYNEFKNAAVQILRHEQFLPVEQNTGSDTDYPPHDYIFEPDAEFIIKKLIPDSLKTQLFKALLDSFAAEQGARMTAMHKATDNAADLIKELKLTYNKLRQADITKEISEITAGADALGG